MARFKVIKAHDGMKEGDVKTLPSSPLTEYMVSNGYWREVKPRKPRTTKTANDD